MSRSFVSTAPLAGRRSSQLARSLAAARRVACALLLLAFLSITGHPAAAPMHAANPDLAGFWQSTNTSNYGGGTTGYCSWTLPLGSTTSFSANTSCTNSGYGTIIGTVAVDGTFTADATSSKPAPWTSHITGTFDAANNAASGTWQCTFGLTPLVCAALNGTSVATRLPPPDPLAFPGTFSAGPGTTITWSGTGPPTYVSLESLTAGNPPAPGTIYAHIFALRFSPSQVFSPCTSGGAGSGGPELKFHVPVEQVVPAALPISVFVFNSITSSWENVGAGNVPDGSGGYYVSAIVCHFSLYTAFGPAPLVVTSVGGIAEQPDVAARPSAAEPSGRDYTAAYIVGAAVALIVAAAGAAGWRKRRV